MKNLKKHVYSIRLVQKTLLNAKLFLTTYNNHSITYINHLIGTVCLFLCANSNPLISMNDHLRKYYDELNYICRFFCIDFSTMQTDL
jgi:hypothetical protein